MGTITDTARRVYRDFNVDAVPSSGASKPIKTDIRGLFGVVDATISSLAEGLVLGNAIVKDTRAHLFADLAHAADTLGVVWDDGDLSGVYIKVGGSGTGSWTLTDISLPASFISSATLLSKLNPRGNWAPGQAYLINDVVTYGGILYVAATNHTSSSSFEDDLAALKWTVFASQSFSLPDGAIPNVKLADMPANTLKMNPLDVPGAPQDQTYAQFLSELGFSGSGGAAMIGSTSAYANAVVRPLSARVGEANVVPEDFGATGIATDDQYPAFVKWLAAIGAGAVGRLNAREYRFSQPLVFPAVNHRKVYGEGRYQTSLVYSGAANNVDLLLLGDDSRETRGWNFRDFRIDSVTTMNSGAAFRGIKTIFCEYDFVLNGFYGTGSTGIRDFTGVKLFDGIYMDQFLYNSIRNSDIKVRGNGIKCRGGTVGGQFGAGLLIEGGWRSVAGLSGVLMGGDCCVLMSDLDIIGCGQYGIRIDNSLRPGVGNSQIFLGQNVSIDQSGIDGISVDDNQPGYQYLQIDGTWSASNLRDGINIANWGVTSPVATLLMNPGRVTNNLRDGIRVATNIPYISATSGLVDSNVGIGINNVTAGLTQPFSKFRVGPGFRSFNQFSGVNYSGVIDGFPEVIYRRHRVKSLTPASPGVQFDIAHGLDAVGAFNVSQRAIEITAWYWTSSNFRVKLDVLYCGSANVTLRGRLPLDLTTPIEGNRPLYMDILYSPEEVLV